MDLINRIAHRPWALTSKNWIMRQSWRNLLFVHWPIPEETLRPHIPSVLQIDTFNRTAWIGMVVFFMKGIYLRGMPLVSLTPSFSEINIRTYVKYNGKRGVYFLSLDTDDLASNILAKRWYRLPYHYAQVSMKLKAEEDIYHFHSARKHNSRAAITSTGSFIPDHKIYCPKENTLDHWLTERYCLFSTNNGKNIYCGEIHHEPWPLQKAKAEIHENSLLSPFNIDMTDNEPIAHFSAGVDTLVWNIKKLT